MKNVMSNRFYDSVEIPREILNGYDRIFFLRNLYQKPDLFSDELTQLEEELVAILPVLDQPEVEIETYSPSELSMGALEKMFEDDIRPIVIRGYAKEHDAVKLWSPEYFKEKYGHYKIFFTSTENLVNDIGTTMSEFVDQVLAGNPNRNYIENMTDIFNQFPELHSQVGVENIRNYLGNYASYHRIAQFFLGGRATGAVFHCANELNCFINIYGRKKWNFVHPKYAVAMSSTIMNKGFFVGSFVKHRSSKRFIEEHTPLYNRIPRLSIVLEPGDVLFNPPWWWHAVDNQTESTIAVATRWKLEKEYIRQNPCYDLVESMRVERMGNRNNLVGETELVVSDEKFRKNYMTYAEMGWQGK
jgi:hypothetical protein